MALDENRHSEQIESHEGDFTNPERTFVTARPMRAQCTQPGRLRNSHAGRFVFTSIAAELVWLFVPYGVAT